MDLYLYVCVYFLLHNVSEFIPFVFRIYKVVYKMQLHLYSVLTVSYCTTK